MQKKTKIVIADDNPDICKALRDLLSEKEYLVEVVKNGYELLAYLKNKSADIIILDLMMPEKDGMEVISAIKDIAPYTKIVIYTGFAKYNDSSFVKLADRFLLKNENPEKLLLALEEFSGT